MARLATWVAFGASTLLLAACASGRNLVVVLPESNGHVGAVVVHKGADQTVLNKAYAADRLGSGAHGPTTVSSAKVNAIFGEALAAMPQPPVAFTLYFPEASTDIDPSSRETLGQVFAEVRRRKISEIVITGHTDTVGNDADNDELSKERADAIKRELSPILAGQGIPPDSVTTVGRGKRELFEQEPDNTPDAKNRRVVITVR
jgi:OOP family OmpA-OmpF porin